MSRAGVPEVVVLGGGVGGTLTANLLSRRLGDRVHVRLVDATGLHVYQPGLLYVSLGMERSGRLTRDVRSLLRDDVELVVDRATRIDATAAKIELERGGVTGFDFLVLATGSQLDYSTVPGLREGSHNFYGFAEAERLREALRRFDGGRLLIGVAGFPYKCPPAPVEFALLVDGYLRRRGIRERTQIDFLSPLGRAFTIESASRMVEPIFVSKGIRLHTFANVERVDPTSREVTTLEDETFGYDLAVLIPQHKGADAVVGPELTNDSQWVPVDPGTLQVRGQQRIYALGDCTDLPISKAGSTAHFEAPVVTEGIAAAIEGRDPHPVKGRYAGKVMCFLETGDRKATLMRFDYENPPRPPRPSFIWHLAKRAFNRGYWWIVPPGRF